MINFGKNITYLRTQKGLGQEAMSNLIGFSRSQWNNYEKNTSYPKFLDLIKIAKYFDISETDLIHNNLEYAKNISSFSKKKVIDNDLVQSLKKINLLQDEKITDLKNQLSKIKKEQKPAIYDQYVAEPAIGPIAKNQNIDI